MTIFLDIDGVLNSMNWYKATKHSPIGGIDMDEEKVKLLGKFVKETNADVICSSTWRIHFEDYFNKDPDMSESVKKWVETHLEILERHGIKFSGCTPRILKKEWYVEWPQRKKELEFFGRVYEIATYIKEHNLTGKFIAIDDDIGDMIPLSNTNNLVRTSWEDGFMEEHLDLARQCLEKGMSCEEWLKYLEGKYGKDCLQ